MSEQLREKIIQALVAAIDYDEAADFILSVLSQEDGWRPIESAPLNTPIEVRMRNWVATAVLVNQHIEEDHYEVRADIKHYNGNTIIGGFRGPLDSWRPLPEPPHE